MKCRGWHACHAKQGLVASSVTGRDRAPCQFPRLPCTRGTPGSRSAPASTCKKAMARSDQVGSVPSQAGGSVPKPRAYPTKNAVMQTHQIGKRTPSALTRSGMGTAAQLACCGRWVHASACPPRQPSRWPAALPHCTCRDTASRKDGRTGSRWALSPARGTHCTRRHCTPHPPRCLLRHP